MKRLKSYFFTNTNLNSRGKYISLKDNAEPNETLFSDLLDSVVKPKVGTDYQDQADYNAVNTKDSSKFVTAENLPEVDSEGSLLTIATTAAVNTDLLRRKKYTVTVNTPTSIDDITDRGNTTVITPANLPKFELDNSAYTAIDDQASYYESSITVAEDLTDFFLTYKLKMKALTSEMMTHASVKLSTVLNTLRTDVNACVSDAELASAVSSLTTAINLKATKVSPSFVTGYNGTKVTVNSQGIVTAVSKANAGDITNNSSVSGSTVAAALDWLKANGGGTGGASDTDGVTNLSDVPGSTATDAFNTLLEATQKYFIKDVIGKTNGDTLEVDKINVLNLTSNTSFTLPTPSLSLKGKVLIVVQSNASNAKAEIFGAAQGPIVISDFRDVFIFNCVYDVGGGGEWFLISRDDSKTCPTPVIVESSSHNASANENIKADAQSLGADITVTIPTALSEGRMIYVYYPTGSPSAYVVELAGGYTATLVQGDWFLLRDNGSFWVAIGSSQNTPDLSAYELLANKNVANGYAGLDSGGKLLSSQLPDIAVTDYLGSVASQAAMLALSGQKGDWAIRTDTGTVFIITGSNPSVIGSWTEMAYPAAAVANVLGTLNRVTVSGGTTKTIDIASTYVGQTSITTLGTIATGTWQGTAIADAYIASASTWNAKLGVSGGTLTGALNEAPSITLASASTVNIGGANSANIIITGTTTITSFDTAPEGVIRYVKFSSNLTLTNNANILLLNGGNLSVKSGEACIFKSDGAGAWRLIQYFQIMIGVVAYTDSPTFTNGRWGVSPLTFGSSYEKARFTANATNNYTEVIPGVEDAVYFNNTLRGGYKYTTNLFTFYANAGQNVRLSYGGANVGLGDIQISSAFIGHYHDYHVWATKNYTTSTYATLDTNGLVLGNQALSGDKLTINSACQLDMQSTTKGCGLPSVPTSAGLTASRAGNFRYNPTTVVPEYADGSRWVKLPKFYTQVTTQTIANTTTETSMFNDTGALGTRTIPGSSTQVGSYFRIRLDGYFGSTAGPAITVKIKMGSVVIFDTTLTVTYSPSGSQQWYVEAYFTVQAIGSGTSANVFGQGRFCYATTPSTPYNILFVTNTAVSSGYDSTASQVLDVTFTWNTANAANTITTTNAIIEQIN